jgi:hypothetical protein
MKRFIKISVLVLALAVVCTSQSMASGRSSGGPKAFNTLPTTTRTAQVISTRVSMVIPTKTTQVVPGKTTFNINPKTVQVINPKTFKVIVTKVIPTQVIFGVPGIIYGTGRIIEVPVVPVQYERWLRLHNDTADKLTVFLRYHTQDVTGQWDWIPEVPSPQSTKWLAFDLQPGEVLEPKFGELPIAANKIRIYAQSSSGLVVNLKDDDFWLVPEVTPEGEHLYYSEYRQTFDFNISSYKK